MQKRERYNLFAAMNEFGFGLNGFDNENEGL